MIGGTTFEDEYNIGPMDPFLRKIVCHDIIIGFIFLSFFSFHILLIDSLLFVVHGREFLFHLHKNYFFYFSFSVVLFFEFPFVDKTRQYHFLSSLSSNWRFEKKMIQKKKGKNISLNLPPKNNDNQ